MDRVWLLSNTTYGTWLPGDPRGFVGQVRDHRDDDPAKPRVRHNAPRTEYDHGSGGLHFAAVRLLKAPPVRLTADQAAVIVDQFRETARFRGWEVLAAAVMDNHFHIVVGVPGDPDPAKVLGDFKSWATRALNAAFGRPPGDRWWTESGSKRKKANETAVREAVEYVRFRQPNPLVVWPPAEEAKASVGA